MKSNNPFMAQDSRNLAGSIRAPSRETAPLTSQEILYKKLSLISFKGYDWVDYLEKCLIERKRLG